MSSFAARSLEFASSSREAELQALLHEHDEAKAAGATRVVFVRGPRGIGRSTLLAEFAQRTVARSRAHFEAASGRTSKQPFGAFVGLVPQWLGTARALGLSEASWARLARGVEAITSRTPAPPREELFAAVAELLATVGQLSPAVIFDDVDAADAASLELLRYLVSAATVPGARGVGLLVLAFRDDARLPKALEELIARVSARTLSLQGLDLDGIRAYLQREDVARRLLELSQGSPTALDALLEQPVTPVDFVARRLERLPAEDRALLQLLALAPGPLGGDVLSHALRTTSSALGAQLDGLLAQRLIATAAVDGRALWRIAREADAERLAGGLTPTERRRTSVALAQALEQAGALAPAAGLLFDADEPRAAEVGLSAVDQLVIAGGMEDAAALLGRCAAKLSGPARAQALLRQGKLLEQLGRFSLAARRLLAGARADASCAATARLDAAALLVRAGRLGAARVVLGAAPDAAHRPLHGLRTAELEIAQGDAAGALARLDAIRGSPRADLAQIALAQGKALLRLGRPQDALAAFERAQAEASEPTVQAAAALNAGAALLANGAREQALARWQQVPATFPALLAYADLNLGSAYADAGDFELAVDALSRALAAWTQLGSDRNVAQLATNLARVHLTLGELARAQELVEFALGRARAHGDGYGELGAQLTRGALLLERQEATSALGVLEHVRQGYERAGNDAYAAHAAALKARAHLARGERAQAELELGRAAAQRGATATASASLAVELVRAEVSLGLGDLLGAGRAVTRAKDALLSCAELEGPYRVAYLTGRIKSAGGDAAGAAADFVRAARLLDQLVQRVPAAKREGFLALARRAEVLVAAEPEQRFPRAVAALKASAGLERAAGLIGNSEALRRITKQLEPIGRSNATALIRGESGTGKELLADALHQLSPRRHMPLVKVNCAAMVEELLLSELFGHEKGAFTGAVRERKGRFEMADGGTIFLDEIGDISPKAQVALLRVLQEREFERVGGSKTIKVDVRVLCATNRDLDALIAQGIFRADLYYRLKGVMLVLPPLRERTEDLPLLARHFLERRARERQEPVRRLTDAALELLTRHPWPGNVREFENVIEAAAIFAEGPAIDVEAFLHIAELRALVAGEPQPAAAAPVAPVAARAPMAAAPAPTALALPEAAAPPGPLDFYELARSRGISLKELRHEIDMQCIRRALIEANGNISEAARLLGMKRSRLSQIVNAEPMLREVAHGE